MLHKSDLDALRAIIREELQSIQNLAQDEILGVDECATLLGVTPQTVYKHAKLDLKCTKIGKAIYFKKSDIMAFVTENRKPTIKEQLEAYNAMK